VWAGNQTGSLLKKERRGSEGGAEVANSKRKILEEVASIRAKKERRKKR